MSTTRVTTYEYDWRGRQIAIHGEEGFAQRTQYDNLDRPIRVERYDTEVPAAGSSSSSSSGGTVGNLISRTDTKYDARGRVYQTHRYAVNAQTGAVGPALIDRTWYDASGRVIKQQPAGSRQFTKFRYDPLGRQVKQFIGYDTDESTYAEAASLTDDTILEQIETDYDAAGNAIETRHRRRHHDATGTGELTTPSGAQPKARVSYTAHYQDAVGRSVATANYGTNADVALSRSATIPARSDDVLVTSSEYNASGELHATVDPAGRRDCFEYDAAGRQTKEIRNCVANPPSSSSSGGPQHDDTNVTVRTEYNADGQVSRLIAENPATGDQVTQYVYGSTLSDSDIARNDLLRAEIYPDSDDVASPLGNGLDNIYDRIEYRYNRQGERTEKKDQNGTVHAYDYNGLGRQIHDRITTLGSGVDGSVLRVSTTYEIRGLVESVTTHDNATVGSGNVVNEVSNEYNDLGMLVKQYQEHDGAKDTSTLYVGYNYDETAVDGEFTKGLRQTSLRYPNGRLVHYTYGTSGSVADSLNRLDAIQDDDGGSPGDVLASYTYLGLGTVVIEDYQEPQIRLDLFGGTSGTYAGFDRFDRVIDHRWLNYNTSTDIDRFKYGYDRASNRIWKENTVSKAQTTPVYLDELYSYDGLHRLKTFDRGELNGTKTAITGAPAKEEDWTLDALGNWSSYLQKTNGTTDLNQQRSANAVNEITDITESTGSSWVTPAYDKNGNMTLMPQPENPTASFTCTYDPWNHLVQVADSTSTIAEYSYDALHRRVTKTADSETRHFLYTPQWQAIEERLASSPYADRQFIWGPMYIDHLILRDRDTELDGTLDERLYALQDANWNVTALASTDGDYEERYLYDPYGMHIVLTRTFASQTNSDYQWHTLFGAYDYDVVMLYFARRRIYHFHMGLWGQRDIVGYADGLHLTRYVAANPIKFIDPSGAFRVCAQFHDGIAGFIEELECDDYGLRGTPRSGGHEPIHVTSFPRTTLNSTAAGMAEYCVHRRARGFFTSWTVLGWTMGSCGRDSYFVDAHHDVKVCLCNCAHIDLCSSRFGQLRYGLYGPPARFVPCTFDANRDDELAKRITGRLKHGAKSGTLCRYATDADIRSCIAAKPIPTTIPQRVTGNPGAKGDCFDNCRTDIKETIKACCLDWV